MDAAKLQVYTNYTYGKNRMNEFRKEKAILGARRNIRKYPHLKEVFTLGLMVWLLGYYICDWLVSNTKKLTSMAVLLVFFTISCSFCAPIFQTDQETEQQVFTEHLETEDIMLATETETVEMEGNVIKEEDQPTEAEEVVNPEAEDGENIANYSSDEILANYDPEDLELAEVESGEVSAQDWSLLLVNNRHPIPEDYEFTLGTIWGSLQCDERIIPPFLGMLQAAKEDGITLEVCSPYRTLDRQEHLFDRKIVRYMKRGMSYMEAYKLAARVVNVPGTSEHQIGLALDIYTDSYKTLDEGFGETAAGIWLRENCAEYGFILRYPKGKEYITGIEYEPWHFRYVGKTAAKEIMGQGLTLEEYVEQLE